MDHSDERLKNCGPHLTVWAKTFEINLKSLIRQPVSQQQLRCVCIHIIINTDTVMCKEIKLDIFIVSQCLSYVVGCFCPLTPYLPCWDLLGYVGWLLLIGQQWIDESLFVFSLAVWDLCVTEDGEKILKEKTFLWQLRDKRYCSGVVAVHAVSVNCKMFQSRSNKSQGCHFQIKPESHMGPI